MINNNISSPTLHSKREAVLQAPLEPGQYTSDAFQQVLDDHHVLGSIGSVGDAYDTQSSWSDSMSFSSV
jgi:hypothetical protein